MQKPIKRQTNEINISDYVKGTSAIFIDAANIFYSQKTLGWKIDYRKLKVFFSKRIKLMGLFYYSGRIGKYKKQLGFIKHLEKIGYFVYTKEVKFIKISNGTAIPKGNLDIELALDAYRFSDKYDTLILFSGDSDFGYLLDILKEKQKWIIVVSTRGHISKELLERAKYIDLRKLKKHIIYKQGKRP